MEDIIYLDNAATTQTKEEVINRMQPFFSELYGNAASIYRFAGKATKAVDEARQIRCEPGVKGHVRTLPKYAHRNALFSASR